MPNPATPSTTAEAAVRAHFGLSQQELASYLGVSAGLVAHLEAGRRRPAPATVARLTALALLLPPPEGHGPPAPPAPTATPTNPAALPEGPATPLAPGPLRQRQRACRLLAATLGARLHALQKGAATLARRRRGLAQLQAALLPTADAATAGWLAGLAQAVAAPSPAAATAQVLLAVRIEALTAEAAALGRLLGEAD